jgi:hypothetical protein
MTRCASTAPCTVGRGPPMDCTRFGGVRPCCCCCVGGGNIVTVPLPDLLRATPRGAVVLLDGERDGGFGLVSFKYNARGVGGVELSSAADELARRNAVVAGGTLVIGRGSPSPDCDRPNGGLFESKADLLDCCRDKDGGGADVFAPNPFMDCFVEISASSNDLARDREATRGPLASGGQSSRDRDRFNGGFLSMPKSAPTSNDAFEAMNELSQSDVVFVFDGDRLSAISSSMLTYDILRSLPLSLLSRRRHLQKMKKATIAIAAHMTPITATTMNVKRSASLAALLNLFGRPPSAPSTGGGVGVGANV